MAGLFALMLFGLLGVAAATGWEETKAQLLKLSLWQVGVLLFLSLCNYLLRGARWHVYSGRLGLKLSPIANFRHFLGGFAMSVTPGRVGELIRMRWIRRETGWPFERTAPLVLADRAGDLAAMAMLLAASVTLSAAGINGAVPVVLITLGIAIVVTRPSLLTWGATQLYRALGFWPRVFARLRAAARSMKVLSHPIVLSIALHIPISVPIHCSSM